MARHSWARLKEHNYLCKKCGMLRVHLEVDASFQTHWHLPDGTQSLNTLTPPCEPGPKTDARLALWAERGSPDHKKARKDSDAD